MALIVYAVTGSYRGPLFCAMTVFFVAQATRLVLAAALRRSHRLAPLSLLLFVLLWAVGSELLDAPGALDVTRFPARGEVWFLAAYLAIAAFLVIDGDRRLRLPLDMWLHVVVICGGTACLAGSVLLTPVSPAYDRSALSLFLALLYPLIDLILGMLVIGQRALGLRDPRTAGMLFAGLLCFTFADAHFVAGLSTGTYHFSVASMIAWAIGLVLIIEVGCRPRTAATRVSARSSHAAQTLGAAAIATVVLAIHRGDGIGLYLTIPAVLTLIGAGGRLALALREARGAADALALSLTDDLTRLPNRRALRSAVDTALESAEPIALMLLDMDGFKDVNDTLGHSAGDDVLRLMAQRLREAISPSSMVLARLGGDEFAALVRDVDEIGAMEAAQALLAQLRDPLRIDGIEIMPSASIGVAWAPNVSNGATSDSGLPLDTSELLRRADVAMYQAKQNHLGVMLYDPADDDFSKTKLMLVEDLRRALDENRLELWYQPQIDAVSQRVTGLEALLRWRHPTQGVLSPGLFLPAARRAGLMTAVSMRVAELAVRDIAAFASDGLEVHVSVNCAPPELFSGAFLPYLYDCLQSWSVPPERLVIELTEDSFMADPERARHVVHSIRERGVQVAIDDYGTGFSSLAYLRDLAIDELKIDRSFISGMATDPRTRMIVASTLQMAAALSMRTVAEGVADAETASDLTSLGVDRLQGYFVSRAIHQAEVVAWIRQWEENQQRAAEPDRLAPAERPEPLRPRRTIRVLSAHRLTVRQPTR